MPSAPKTKPPLRLKPRLTHVWFTGGAKHVLGDDWQMCWCAPQPDPKTPNLIVHNAEDALFDCAH